MEYKYLCIRSQQTTSTKRLVQFSAPASEINYWAGVPQKKRFDLDGEPVGETVGFQRQENLARVASLRKFYDNPDNIIQNPILCSLRDIPQSSVKFVPVKDFHPDQPSVALGYLVIDVPDFSSFSIEKCIKYVRDYIEHRVPALKSQKPNAALLRTLRARAADHGYIDQEKTAVLAQGTGHDADSEAQEENEDPTGVLFEESHIKDFWEELAARDEIVKEIPSSVGTDSFLGFAKDALLSYLRPIVLVDGQHRVRGALAAAEEKLDNPEIQSEIETLIDAGKTSTQVEAAIMKREARALPVSLLMSTDPEEQVFQFVVVNQKATPIGRALLGTIVSTTLSNEEMAKVATRLTKAGIKVEEAQAITFLVRYSESPFRDLVDRGVAGDATHTLQWNVFASLVGMFRHLKGGRLFGERNDYADLWRGRYLAQSPIVADYKDHGFETPFDYWSKLDGPWRAVFMEFWREVRDALGNTQDPEKPNYWGRPRDSNLFNKISLTILASDFFQFLKVGKIQLEKPEQIPSLVQSWLEEVNQGYFDKDWELTGVKKDSVGIRNHWATLWSDYRKSGGKLPSKTLFRIPKSRV